MDKASDGSAGVPREVELKLECAGPDLTALAAHPLLQAAAAAEPEHLVTAYYDTPDRDLLRAGLTLRVRTRNDGGHTQTVKAGFGGVGLFDRAEWEAGIAGPEPDPAAWRGTAADPVLREAGTAPERLFATVVARRTATVTVGETEVLVTLDEGRVEGADGDAPLCELELEVGSGRTADLFALAQALAETVPLRLGVLSKSARGFVLLDGKGPAASKAEAIELPEGASAAEVFRRVARGCLRHLRLNEDAFLRGARDPDALHQMRVALRRLRSALSLFAPVLAHDPRAAVLADEIRRVTEPFGHGRNLDVFLAETLPLLAQADPDDPGIADLRLRAKTERERAYYAVLAILESPQWRGLILDVAGWVETGGWADGPGAREDGRAFAGRVLDEARRRLKKRGRGLRRLDPETRHRARIAAKKLRYGTEFFADLYPKGKAHRRRKAFGSLLADLQDHLGALNDLETARDVIGGLGAPPGTGGSGPHPGRSADLLDRSADARTALLDAKPFWR